MLITVVTISYNQGQFLEQAIQSVLSQRRDGPKIQYVVVDAGSTDDSKRILSQYSPEIDVLIVEEDRGPADGLNKGFRQATGEIMGFLNADDLLEPGSLATVHQYLMANPQADAVIGRLREVSALQRTPPKVLLPSPFTLRRFSEGRIQVLQQATFFRRRAWDMTSGFNPDNHTCWDLELFVEMAASGAVFDTLQRILATFRIHEGSISGSGRLQEQSITDRNHIRDIYRPTDNTPNATVNAIKHVAWRARPILRARGVYAGVQDRAHRRGYQPAFLDQR